MLQGCKRKGCEVMTDKLKKIAGFYKFENQSRQLSEECAELIQAVNKYQRYSSRCSAEPSEYDWKYYQNIVEEIADVEVMLEQIKILLNINNAAVEEIKRNKVDRQLERIRKEVK